MFKNLDASNSADEFADEEVESNRGYLLGYKPRSVTDQMVALRASFPQLESFDKGAIPRNLPPGAEGLFLVPRWQVIASTYHRATEIVFAKLEQGRQGRIRDYREGEFGQDHLRETAKKSRLFQVLGDEQKEHNVFVVAAQFGLRHRGKSIRRARVVMGDKECGLGAFEVGSMLLSHSARLANYTDLTIDCAGDEYLLGDECGTAPSFFAPRDGGLELRERPINRPIGHYGSVSAFISAEI